MVTSYIAVWLLTYLLPALLACGVIYFLPNRSSLFRVLIIHGALCLSIFLSQYFIYLNGNAFSWYTNLFSILFLVLVIGIAPFLVGRFGIFYILSSFIQELTMVSIAYYLFNTISFWAVVVLVVPIYAVAHLMNLKYWKFRLFVTLLWGTISIALFAWRADIVLNTALHAVFGLVLIRQGILYTLSDFSVTRSNNPHVQSWIEKYL